MTFETVLVAVIGEGHVARLALGHVAALLADDRLRIAATVEKEDRLIALF